MIGLTNLESALRDSQFQLNVLVCFRDTLRMYGHCLDDKYAGNPYVPAEIQPLIQIILRSLEEALRETERQGKRTYEYLQEMHQVLGE